MMIWTGFCDEWSGSVHLQSLHCGTTAICVLPDDGFPSDGFSPPPELKYSSCGVMMKMKPKRAACVPCPLCPIRCGVKPSVPSSVGEPHACDGSPPPSPKYGASTDEACRLKWNDGFLTWIQTVVNATGEWKPMATHDDSLKMMSLPSMNGDVKPVEMMNSSVLMNDGSPRLQSRRTEPKMNDGFLLRASDGSCPQSRMVWSDVVKPVVMQKTDGGEPAAVTVMNESRL